MSDQDKEVAGWYAADMREGMENRDALIAFLESLSAS